MQAGCQTVTSDTFLSTLGMMLFGCSKCVFCNSSLYVPHFQNKHINPPQEDLQDRPSLLKKKLFEAV